MSRHCETDGEKVIQTHTHTRSTCEVRRETKQKYGRQARRCARQRRDPVEKKTKQNECPGGKKREETDWDDKGNGRLPRALPAEQISKKKYRLVRSQGE